MTALKILLSIFPFGFAAFLAAWAFVALAVAFRKWTDGNERSVRTPDAMASVFGAIGLALAALFFGAVGFAIFQ